MPLSTFLKVSAAIALATGTGDVLLGSRMLEGGAGEPFPINSPVQILADSQIRFLGGMWAGWGAMLWWVSDDIRQRRTPLAILGTVIFLSGMGRVIGGIRHGFKPGLLIPFTLIELVVPPAVYLLGGW